MPLTRSRCTTRWVVLFEGSEGEPGGAEGGVAAPKRAHVGAAVWSCWEWRSCSIPFLTTSPPTPACRRCSSRCSSAWTPRAIG